MRWTILEHGDPRHTRVEQQPDGSWAAYLTGWAFQAPEEHELAGMTAHVLGTAEDGSPAPARLGFLTKQEAESFEFYGWTINELIAESDR